MNRISLFDLAFTYIQRFFEEEPNIEIKREIIETFEDLLFDGWTSNDIIKILRAFTKQHPDKEPDLNKLFNKQTKKHDNLLSPFKFYYHNQLRITPSPPKRELDYNTGQIIKIQEDWYLEMRASYTIDHLIDYYEKQFDTSLNHHERKRTLGSFKYLLKTHDIDTLLFMIDSAANHRLTSDQNRKDFNPLNLTDYRPIAEEMRNEKRTENVATGDDKIVPRKRVFTFRSRDSI